ncbi:MAG: flavin reductase family protein, partial [Pseudomonas sp.]|nr:flavin reductase family protein [Pseudomonas sp.]
LAGATAVIECELWREYEGGDHAIMVGKVHNLIVPEQAPLPMVYCRGKMASLPALA